MNTQQAVRLFPCLLALRVNVPQCHFYCRLIIHIEVDVTHEPILVINKFVPAGCTTALLLPSDRR